MSESIHLTQYHEAVKSTLQAQLPWLLSIKDYPKIETPLLTPCAFFSVSGWEKSTEQKMNGQLSVTLSCEVLAVLGMEHEAYQVDIRNSAMAISLAIEANRFGLEVEPAVFVSADPDAFQPELDEYAVWSIRFEQEVQVGEDAFKPEGQIPNIVNVGYSPDIGESNQDKYEQVVPNE
ncbi:hypothetical protein RC856_000359 [Vibrio fluvialis]|nr:hypothetical protein [Vibrio fluvialis]